LLLNGQRLDLCFSKGYLQQHVAARASVLLDVSDSLGDRHAVNISADARDPSYLADVASNRHLYPTDVVLKLVSIDDNIITPPTEVLARLDVYPERKLRSLLYYPSPKLISFDNYPQSFTQFKPSHEMAKLDKDDLLDLQDELEVLRMLEANAVTLQKELAARKLVVNQRVHKRIADVPLKALIEHCDGIICAAKILAGRLCDTMGVASNNPPDYSEIDSHLQYMMTATGDSQRTIQIGDSHTGSDKSSGTQRPKSASTGATSQSTSSAIGTLKGRPRFFAKKNLDHPLIIALEVLAGIIGLTALCTFIHRKCMSMRKRVERAADKEERRNARAYRRAARRALMRKKWNGFLSSISCFTPTTEASEPRDYDDKRAMILQDAFLEQEIDLAEKGEIMEAQIRELRNAHDIVAGLLGVDEHRFDLAGPNPPPNAYFATIISPQSTGTLPSYTSESLPDYTSTPETSEGSSRVADGFTNYTPATSKSDAQFSASRSSSGSRQTRYTPVSSVMAITPRCSAETLRTRQSGDS
jgi:hypothetical protein